MEGELSWGEKNLFLSASSYCSLSRLAACSAEGQEGQGIWHNEYESEIEISSTEEEQ